MSTQQDTQSYRLQQARRTRAHTHTLSPNVDALLVSSDDLWMAEIS